MAVFRSTNERTISPNESEVSFQLAEPEDRKLEAYATINSQPGAEGD